MKLNKTQLAFLGKLMHAEVIASLNPSRLHVVQGHGKVVEGLKDKDMIRETTVTLRGRFPVKITGWEMTELGRMTFCMSCGDEGDTFAPAEAES